MTNKQKNTVFQVHERFQILFKFHRHSHEQIDIYIYVCVHSGKKIIMKNETRNY